MRLIGALLIGALLCGTAHAADKETKYQVVGVGAQTCQVILKGNDEDRKLAEMWWTGYVTAVNWLTDNTWSTVGKEPNARVNAAILKQCQDHPTGLYMIAVHDAVQSLYKEFHLEALPKD